MTTIAYDATAGIIVLRPGIQGVWMSRNPLPGRSGALVAETLGGKIYVAGGDLTWGGGSMTIQRQRPRCRQRETVTPAPWYGRRRAGMHRVG